MALHKCIDRFRGKDAIPEVRDIFLDLIRGLNLVKAADCTRARPVSAYNGAVAKHPTHHPATDRAKCPEMSGEIGGARFN